MIRLKFDNKLKQTQNHKDRFRKTPKPIINSKIKSINDKLNQNQTRSRKSRKKINQSDQSWEGQHIYQAIRRVPTYKHRSHG